MARISAHAASRLALLLTFFAVAIAGGCSSMSGIGTAVGTAIMNDPVFQTYVAAAVTHADCNCNVWIVTPADSDADRVEAFLAFSSDNTVTWSGPAELPSTVAQSLRTVKAPSTLASPLFVLEAIERTGRSADVLILSGFEGDALASNRAQLFGGLPADWVADPNAHSAWRKRLENVESPQDK
jgi:hypothetical protein